MKFGEKVRELRKKCGMTQAELAKKAGLGLKTITNYESGSTYPQNREVYATLAGILGCEADYLRSENEEFIAMAQREYGYRGKKGAKKLVEELTGLFAGGEMSDDDIDPQKIPQECQECGVTVHILGQRLWYPVLWV